MLDLKPLVHRILEDYLLPWHGMHGVGHWARVLENGLRLTKETQANVEVVQLFAIFHDAGRGDGGASCRAKLVLIATRIGPHANSLVGRPLRSTGR